MEKVDDKTYVLRYWDKSNDRDNGRSLTYKADTPHLVSINLRDYYLFELPIINRLLNTNLIQYQYDIWDWRVKKLIGKGQHVYDALQNKWVTAQDKMPKTYLNRKEWSKLWATCKPFVDYLSITNKIRDKGFSREETDKINTDGKPLLHDVTSDDQELWYRAAKRIAQENAYKCVDGRTYWRQTKSGDALTKFMLNYLRDQMKKEHATELFYQKEVPITKLTKDSNAKYLAYIKRSDV
jgi:hypothetical protein|tara:strand:- start:1337 stop:2050 length:714 start_codon:yes stop_codon:yes gene_type:complete